MAADEGAEVSTPEHDIVFVLSYTSWSGAVARRWIMPEDRLALALMRSRRVRRLLVCNPYRSLASKLVRSMILRSDASFPASAKCRLHEPVRLRRSDPTEPRAIERSCAAYERGLARAVTTFRLERPIVITTHPLLAGFGHFDWAGPVTYYVTDDFTAYPPMRPWWPSYRLAYERLRSAGRRVVAVTPKSLESVGPDGPSAIIPNGIEPAEWLAPELPPAWFTSLPRPRLLYVGALDARMDVAQVRTVADAYPDGSIVLVGWLTDSAHYAPLVGLSNVILHAPVPRGELAGIAAAADLGLIPHVRSQQTEAMSPLKLYEYLAAGLPVAALDLPGIAGVGPDRVQLARAPEDFVAAVARALTLGRAPEAERQEFIRANSWERRFDALLDVALAS